MKLKLYTLYFLVFSFIIGCGKDDPQFIDTEKPVIVCPEDINITIESNKNSVIINYDTPFGRDNVGANTKQTEGLSSGSSFPLGITTNTFVASDLAGNSTTCSFNVIITKDTSDGSTPYFIDNNPTPIDKKWSKIENLSDEFNTNTFDESKWQNTNPNRWIGREPGIFKKNTVTQGDGNLKLTAYKLDAPEVVGNNTYTHAGSNITSYTYAEVGYYTEARIKSSKTFMSTTFWLINERNAAEGCDKRTTELDIQECVGQVTGTASWTQDKDATMNSNTHSRNTSCASTNVGSAGNGVSVGGKTWENYHIYSCWWKSATEIIFYLDGKEVYTITPKANFSLPMQLRMVVETYDWNPVPSDGGMTGSFEDRTAYYDWVRTWKLENK